MAKMTAKKTENLAKEIHSFLVNHGLWVDVAIYFNGKCWSTSNKDREVYAVMKITEENQTVISLDMQVLLFFPLTITETG